MVAPRGLAPLASHLAGGLASLAGDLPLTLRVYSREPLTFAVAGVPRAAREARARELLADVGLADLAGRYPAQLSGGQKQRVGIARALALEPDLLLADEATSALDPETSAGILALLTEVQRSRDLTLIVVTHQLEVVRAACTHVAVLDAGRLVESGETRKVLARPAHPVTRALLDAHRPQLPLSPGETLRRVTLPDLGSGTLERLAALGARLVQAEPHPQGVDAWLVLPETAPTPHLWPREVRLPLGASA
ncbi:ATP-binding cassette domain-containing protein [Deinococcus terrestris]|uniref:ATP-binding cassette domain-containing protein n=1 Tax=Deinococcus terrestris TaxID=2651870 RepID=UPI002AD47798|nr:ATP-binding cassette domain-containing protein [Deinococcus terrestris]